MPQVVKHRWHSCFVAAPGPSLSETVAARLAGQNVIAVNDAWRRVPGAQVLYACDAAWWTVHNGVPDFHGERWSSHGGDKHNNKTEIAEAYGVNLVIGRDSHEGFSTDPAVIHYGSNSGFQAVNLAMLMGARRVILVGFDMHGTHFFGQHPAGLRNTTSYGGFIRAFERAARHLPAGVQILNATPGSALRCFPFTRLEDELSAIALAA